MALNRYKATVRLKLEGIVEVRATNIWEARETIEKHWGAILGNIQASVVSEDKENEGIIDWDFPIHFDKHIVTIMKSK